MEKTLRVLQVLGTLNRGGAESMIMNCYRNIDREIIQFDFVIHTNEACAFDSEIERLGGLIYHCPRYVVINHFQYEKWWKDFFTAHKEYKIIHGHIRSTARIYLKIAKYNGLYTIIHSHSTSSGSGLKALTKDIYQIGITKNSDTKFACSRNAGEWLFRKKEFVIFPNAIDANMYIFEPKKRENIRKILHIEGRFVIGTVGRMAYPKNPFKIINIFKAIKQKNKNAVLLWCGGGELKMKVEKRIIEEKLQDMVILAGIVNNVNDYMQAMDVFLFPSIYEGFSLVLVEAQVAGLPCIVSDSITKEHAITDLINFVSLSEPAEIWARKVRKYENGYVRKNRRDDIFRAGYDIHTLTEWLTDFYVVSSKKYKDKTTSNLGT